MDVNIHADMSDQHLSKSDQEWQICLVFQSKRQDVETLRLRLITTSGLHKTAHAVIIGALAVFKVNQSHENLKPLPVGKQHTPAITESDSNSN